MAPGESGRACHRRADCGKLDTGTRENLKSLRFVIATQTSRTCRENLSVALDVQATLMCPQTQTLTAHTGTTGTQKWRSDLASVCRRRCSPLGMYHGRPGRVGAQLLPCAPACRGDKMLITAAREAAGASFVPGTRGAARSSATGRCRAHGLSSCLLHY